MTPPAQPPSPIEDLKRRVSKDIPRGFMKIKEATSTPCTR